MNTRAAIITAVMVMAALFSSCKKGPQYEDEDNFVVAPAAYKGLRIVEYLDYTQKASINVPPRIKNEPVTEIGPDSIADRWFTKVAIPDTVVNIMDFSFSGNFIREVNFSGKITEIGNGAFMNNRITSIVIPDSVKRIGYRAFFNNPLKSITIGSNVELDDISGYDAGKEVEWKYTAFEGTGFDEAYRESGRLAGTYTKVDGIWQF
ncbi:MAG: leucine-rich repeat domain-containing protein, partial [Treponema sp.]|nr:leucine-rich repeat domain-containing protein [Treponema sp.]